MRFRRKSENRVDAETETGQKDRARARKRDDGEDGSDTIAVDIRASLGKTTQKTPGVVVDDDDDDDVDDDSSAANELRCAAEQKQQIR